MIKIKNVSKYFNKGKSNEIHVINDTTLDLPDKGLVTLLGESGSGKTTLLNVIGGLDKFDSGEIDYGDAKFNKYKSSSIDNYRSNNIGCIFQHYNLLLDRTVYDNLSLQLDIIGISSNEEQQKRIKYALEAVGLYKFRKKLAGQLSGGQMQRVSIARALVKKTKILIADEPTGNLDSKNSVEIMNILKNISKIALVILVTHDKVLAEYYSDQIVEIKDGKVINIRTYTEKNYENIKNRLDYKVYLGDMQKLEDGDKIKTVVYSNEENPDINLTLVEINGTYYIKSNVLIKNIEDANVEIVDSKSEELETNQIEDNFNFDYSFYNDEKKSNWFKRVRHEIAEAYVSNKKTSKRSKLLKIALFVIGCIFSIAVFNFYSYNNVSTSSLIKDDYAYKITTKELESLTGGNTYDTLENKISLGNRTNILFYYNKNSYLYESDSYSTYIFQYQNVSDEGLLMGEAPNSDNEFVVGKKLADKLLKKFKFSNYNQLKNISIGMSYTKWTSICGVSRKNTEAIYVNSLIIKNYVVDKEFNQYGGIVTNENYKVLGGEDVKTADSTTYAPLMFILNSELYDISLDYDTHKDELHTSATNFEEYLEKNYNYGKILKLDDLDYKIVSYGVLTDKDGNIKVNDNVIFKDFTYTDYLYKDKDTYLNFRNADCDIIDADYSLYTQSDISNFSILEGGFKKVSENHVAALAPYYSNLSIGDTRKVQMHYSGDGITGSATKTIEVVGYYNFNDPSQTHGNGLWECIIVQDLDIAALCITTDTYIEINDNAKNYVKDRGINLSLNAYEKEYKDLKKEQSRLLRSSLIESAVMLGICMVYMYFTMRSRMISDIYEIGVLRNIGASKGKVIEKYAIISTISCLTTSFIGYLLSIIIFGVGIGKIQTALGNNYNIFLSIYPYLGGFLLLLISIVFGILPIYLLLRKTPSGISSKYDI